MKILSGKRAALKILNNLEVNIRKLPAAPGLAVLLIGDDKPSHLYARLKQEAAKKIGVRFYLVKFKENAAERKIIEKISVLNKNGKINGIIVQLPLPSKFNARRIIKAIDPEKDVDGFHPENMKLFLKSKERFWPVFPRAIVKLIEESRLKLLGKKAVVLANSQSFGKIMVAALGKKKIRAKYILFKKVKENVKLIKKADIIVVAMGIPNLVKGKMIKEGAVVVDGGITKRGKKVLGDVDRESVKYVASYLSPVPGGVGPVTVACLFWNVYLATKEQLKD
ncbi:MAG: bifunctional 5,10-methylenetetrahydrofolate dehydrogenase/5,10-methenyltetrahydrofolate cyclohydrolase [Candidatus Moranbacteria bacterium]|nr:bifunctional 5,10-methylenetetrahydrofolate dehydrogenase/5,10-methenyltetrahydrofolate cyclohydrolase [Candidatus Moranbacteria bacterium]